LKPKTFQLKKKITRLCTLLKGLNSFLTQSAGELWPNMYILPKLGSCGAYRVKGELLVWLGHII